MLCKMKVVSLVILLLSDTLATPTIEDNKIPTDHEILGQPEEVASLGLPSDEDSFNHLSVFFNPSKPSSPVSGTYHFVSSTFPEIDARGFHESVFDGIGDYFPSWPAPYKRQDNYPFPASLAQKLGLQPHNKFRKRSDEWTNPTVVRRKRYIHNENRSREFDVDQEYNTKPLQKREALAEKLFSEIRNGGKNEVWHHHRNTGHESDPDENYHNLRKRSLGRHGRGMEMGSMGFHGDVFNGDFGDFTTMKKRARGSSGFHGDTFSDGFGDFATMKRSPSDTKLQSKLKYYISKLAKDLPDESHYEDNELGVISKRKPEMTSMGFHGDTFNSGFGDFYPVKKRRPEMDSMGFHGDTFSRGFGDFEPFKRKAGGSMGFHGDTFSQGFGDFDTYKKRRPEMDSMGFHGDTFSRGFGDFEPFKRKAAGSMGFHGDTFSQGFGDFDTYKKRRPEMDSMGFHGDTFSRGFGEFEPFKKRKPAAGSMGFHGDTFSQGFGDFETFKKRRAAAGSMGFHGDTFSQGFGDFDTFKKRRPEMDSSGFHGDTFSRGFGEFEPFKKRKPAAGSMGFHGDTFSQGFGDFETYKKRRPEMDSMGFHGDTFNRGFGEFDLFKRGTSLREIRSSQESNNHASEDSRTEVKNCCSDSSIQRHQDTH